MDEYTFKHCPKGHYYQGDECPYCKAQTTPLERTVVEEPVHDLAHLKTCPNGHAYSVQLNFCPYCGETKVCGQTDLMTGWPGLLKFVFDEETSVKISNYTEEYVRELEVRYLYRGFYKTSYSIVGLQNFDYRTMIKIGGRMFTGKEFIKYIDFMIGIKEYKRILW